MLFLATTLTAVGVTILVLKVRERRNVYSRRERPYHHYDTTVQVGKLGCTVQPATKQDGGGELGNLTCPQK
jgi:hypothetical protein